MKKLLAIMLVLFAVQRAHSAQVPVATMRQAAYNFLLSKGVQSLQSADDLNIVYTSGDQAAYFHIFSGASCFVLVSGYDNVKPIMGYALDRPFVIQDIPTHIAFFLSEYQRQIEDILQNNYPATPEIVDEWNNLAINSSGGGSLGEQHRTTTTVVGPLLASQWGQSYPYNAECPDEAGTGTDIPAGCVATAMAQAMKRWNWPVAGIGIKDYMSQGYRYADFSTPKYDWSSMVLPNTWGADPAAATITYHAGVSVEMDYDISANGGSAALVVPLGGPRNAKDALKTYFLYNKVYPDVRAIHRTRTWTNKLKNELDNGRPIIYGGGSFFGGGHCWVVDGYTDGGYFHINWGWRGTDDGDFSITSLNTSNGNFNHWHVAIFDMYPSCPDDTYRANTDVHLYFGELYAHGYIIAGSTAASGGDPIVHNNTSARQVVAGRYVDIVSNFLAEVTEGNLFEAVPMAKCEEREQILYGRSTMEIPDDPADLAEEEHILQRTPGEDPIMGLADVYPNPASTSITVRYPCVKDGMMKITIIDVSGREVHTQNVQCIARSTILQPIDIHTFTPGVYFVELNVSGERTIKKIVKL